METERSDAAVLDGDVGTPSTAMLGPVSGRQAIEAPAGRLPASLTPRPLADGVESRR